MHSIFSAFAHKREYAFFRFVGLKINFKLNIMYI